MRYPYRNHQLITGRKEVEWLEEVDVTGAEKGNVTLQLQHIEKWYFQKDLEWFEERYISFNKKKKTAQMEPPKK